MAKPSDDITDAELSVMEVLWDRPEGETIREIVLAVYGRHEHSLHGGVKSFAESVFSTSNSFRKVVMIQYPKAGIWSIGFVTAEDVAEIGEKTGVPHSCVYIPTTPNPTSGFFLMMPKSDVIVLDMSVDEALKYIISMGVVSPGGRNRRTKPVAKPEAEPQQAVNG